MLPYIWKIKHLPGKCSLMKKSIHYLNVHGDFVMYFWCLRKSASSHSFCCLKRIIFFLPSSMYHVKLINIVNYQPWRNGNLCWMDITSPIRPSPILKIGRMLWKWVGCEKKYCSWILPPYIFVFLVIKDRPYVVHCHISEAESVDWNVEWAVLWN